MPMNKKDGVAPDAPSPDWKRFVWTSLWTTVRLCREASAPTRSAMASRTDAPTDTTASVSPRKQAARARASILARATASVTHVGAQIRPRRASFAQTDLALVPFRCG